MFKQLNVEVDTAKSTDEALQMLKHTSYDVILSDIARDDSPSDGLEFLSSSEK